MVTSSNREKMLKHYMHTNDFELDHHRDITYPAVEPHYHEFYELLYFISGRSLNDAVKKKYAVRSQLLHSWRLVMPETLPAPLKHLRGEEFTARLPVIFNTVMEGEGIGLPCESQAI